MENFCFHDVSGKSFLEKFPGKNLCLKELKIMEYDNEIGHFITSSQNVTIIRDY